MKRQAPRITDSVELVAAPAAIQRALDVYKQLLPHDPSVVLQAKKILTQHIYGMVDQGEHDEQRLTAGGLAVSFQEVVHLVRTEEAEVAKLQFSTERPDEQPQECSPDAKRSRGDGAVCGGRAQ